MNDFQNMPKRSVELPLGCKDLMDIEAIRSWKPPLECPWRVITDRLGYIEGQLAQLLDSAGKSKLVAISRFAHVMVISDPDLSVPIIFASWRGASEQQSIRRVFEEAGIPEFTGSVGRWKTKGALKYPLPEQAADASRLICEVLRDGHGLGILAAVNLSYHEPKPA